MSCFTKKIRRNRDGCHLGPEEDCPQSAKCSSSLLTEVMGDEEIMMVMLAQRLFGFLWGHYETHDKRRASPTNATEAYRLFA